MQREAGFALNMLLVRIWRSQLVSYACAGHTMQGIMCV